MLMTLSWGQMVSSAEKISILARKLAAARATVSPELPVIAPDFAMSSLVDPAERGWRISLARAARDHMSLALGFETLQSKEVGLVEVLETPMERALILMLEGAGDALGLMIISSPILSGMVEMLTLSRLAPDHGDGPRSPTRTDAAMVVDMIDAALANFAQTMAAQGVMDWAQPYHYAAFIEDPRPLHLMLEDGNYHLLRAEVHLEHGARQGTMTLAVPVQATFQIDFPAPEMDVFAADTGAQDMFNAEFSDQIAAVPTHLDAVLAQITLPLDRILRLQAGEVLALSGAALDSIQLQGLDGLAMAAGKLGQQRGMRAIRLLSTEIRVPDSAAIVQNTMISDQEADYAPPVDLLQVG